MPGTCDSREVTTSAISSWFLTRTITTKSNSPVTEYASATPGTSASAGPSLAIADRSASISTMAVTTNGILSPRPRTLKFLTVRTYVRIILMMKMGVGGISAKTSYPLEDLARGLDLHIRLTNERSEEHTSELQSQSNLVCRLLLEKKNKQVISTKV